MTGQTLAVEPVPSFHLFTIPAAARVLGVSERWLYKQMAAGLIRTVQLGGTTSKQRIRADDLEAFVDSRTHGTAAAAVVSLTSRRTS